MKLLTMKFTNNKKLKVFYNKIYRDKTEEDWECLPEYQYFFKQGDYIFESDSISVINSHIPGGKEYSKSIIVFNETEESIRVVKEIESRLGIKLYRKLTYQENKGK